MRALRGEEFGAVFRDEEIVFEADAEFAGNVDAGLVAEGHAGLEFGVEVPAVHVVANEIGPFVSIEANSVANSVAEVFEGGAVSAINDNFAGGGVDVGCGSAWACGLKRGGLCAPDKVEDGEHLVCRFAEDEGAGDVGLVAFDGAAVIKHENGTFAKRLWLARAVRQCCVLVDVETGFAFKADAAVGGGDERMDVDSGHAGME